MNFFRRFKLAALAGCLAASLWLSQGAARQAAQASYVGNAACVRCHETIARSYAATPMAQSSGEVKAEIIESSFTHQASGVRYRVTREGGAAFLAYERAGAAAISGKQPLQYFIGSNSAGRSYLFSIERFLFQAPVTFYAQPQRWDASPGYEADRALRMNRPIDANCLFCHASQTQPIFGTVNRFAEPPFKHEGVSCERCHGPGSLHVEGKAKLVNPAKLDPARRDSVCAQCHLAGAARVELPNKRLAQFRPGERLSDYVSYFVFEQAAAGLKVNSHVENLAQSRCQQQSGARLSCLNCHDPHSVPKPAARAAWYRQRCLQCHQAERLPGATHRGAAPDCAGCHMPKARTVDGGHGALTDHAIPRNTNNTKQRNDAGVRRLLPFAGFTADERSLGLAYAEAALTSDWRVGEAEALRLLTAALRANPAGDAELFVRLGFLYERSGDVARATRAYEAALRLEPQRTVALVNLGGVYAAQGKLEEAARLWQAALECNAGLTEASFNLARLSHAQGRTQQARELLQKALRFDPDAQDVRLLLKQLPPD